MTRIRALIVEDLSQIIFQINRFETFNLSATEPPTIKEYVSQVFNPRKKENKRVIELQSYKENSPFTNDDFYLHTDFVSFKIKYSDLLNPANYVGICK